LLLMRLQDAIAELDGLEGMQVHRSWWVARAAVSAIRRDDRSLRIVLENGMEVPVSRSCAPALRRAAWGAGAGA
jgi:DNA-binding LytR/AlgR family response regulator